MLNFWRQKFFGVSHVTAIKKEVIAKRAHISGEQHPCCMVLKQHKSTTDSGVKNFTPC